MWIKVCHEELFLHIMDQFISLTQGGDAVWGNTTFAPDDLDERHHSHGELIAFRDTVVKSLGGEHLRNMTADSAGTWILEHTPTHFQVKRNHREVKIIPSD
jgi:hypothetical protein